MREIMGREANRRRALHYFFITSFVVTVVLAIGLASNGYTGTGDGVEEPDKEYYTVYGVEIPGQVSFAG